MIQRYPVNKLPKAGGLNATVVVLMPLETLMGGLKAARLDTGETISPGLARRLACEAAIIPAVLGGKSQVLDLGHRTPVPQRGPADRQDHRGRRLRDRGLRLATRHDCHMHHPIPWSQGGRTDRDAIMICPPHHARAHDPRYTMTKLPTGKYTFHRRT